jgi:antitoxin component YwqK of YwqJK toxin-antitoxin module
MKKLLLFSVFIAGCCSSFAQDTVYLDKTEKITTKETATFYRITTNEGDLYRSEVYYLPSRNLYAVLNYADNELKTLEGTAKYFYADGTPDSEGSYKSNKRNGTWSFYFPDGKISGRVFFRNGRVATSEYIEQYGHMMDGTEDAFPSFKGGKEALILYIRKTFKPLQSTANSKAKINGTMKVGFIVSETGKVTDAHIVSGINDEINEKVIKLINSMPDWYPGRQLDTPVKVPLVIPIIF